MKVGKWEGMKVRNAPSLTHNPTLTHDLNIVEAAILPFCLLLKSHKRVASTTSDRMSAHERL